MRPQRKQPIKWSFNLAYVVGLIATDGSLSINGRHLDFTSQDIQLLETFKKCLGIKNKIGWKMGSYAKVRCPRVQFGDVALYRWLTGIGLTPNKSKTMSSLKIPDEYFFDFIRGHFDGDGHCYGYWDSRWTNSFVFYLVFNSASLNHIQWFKENLKRLAGVHGHINKCGTKTLWQLKYGKRETKTIATIMYRNDNLPRLERKYEKLKNIFDVDNCKNARVVKLVNTLA